MQKLLQIANWLSKLSGIRGDYILHFGVCGLSTSIIGILSFLVVNHFLGYVPGAVASLFGAVFATGLSLGKELGDRNNPSSGWSWNDLKADGLGILFGLVLLYFTLYLF